MCIRDRGNAIIVDDNDELDYEKNPLFKLIIKASDEELSSTGIMTVSLTDDRTEDSDNDGLSEAQEEDIYNTSDLNTDSDGDTYDDGLEVLVGTDPASATSYPSLEDALDYETEYVFSPESKANWFFQAEYKKLGEGAAQSGPIVGGEQSSFSAIVDGPTIVEFWWKVSSENGFDYLSVSVNEEIREKISGETDWILQSVKLPEGSNKLTWKYEKDDSISEGLDTGWVDSIEVLPVTGSIGSLSYIIEDLGVNGVKITSCSNEAIGAVEIPELIEGLPVTIIGDKAFDQCVNVKSISIPESVSYIGTEAFAGNSGLDTLFFAGAPPELGENVFEGIAKTATIVPDQGAEGWENSFQNIEVNFQEIEINQGIVADGYISGATVFIDLNGNGELDKELEPYTLSDDKGNFALTSIKSDAAIIAEGGTDTSTNTFFGGQMKAPNGSTVINPLTTLIETMVSGGLVDTYEEANDELVEVLGLEDVILGDEESINLTNYDPLQKAVDPESTDEDKEIALTVAQAAIQVGSIIVSTVELGGSSQTIVEEISQEILTEEPLAETGTLQERLVETEVIQSLIESSTIEIGIEPTDEIDISELSLGLASTNIEIINSDNSRIRFGRSTTSNGLIGFGNTSVGFPYSSSTSLDIANYGTGNFNFYLEAGGAGVSTGNYYWHRRGNFSRLMTLTNSGTLGLGVTTPINTLHVVGTSTVTSVAHFGNDVNVAGDITTLQSASSFSCSRTGGDKTKGGISDGSARKRKKGVRTPPGDCKRPELGAISAIYESGSDGPATIGKSKTDGYAYGTYQISTRTGTFADFMSWMDDNEYGDVRKQIDGIGGTSGASSGSATFQRNWKALANGDNAKRFAQAQHDYIQNDKYDPVVASIKDEFGIDICDGTHSNGLQDAVWSTAVQHGEGGAPYVFRKALARTGKTVDTVTDAELIEAIYDERSRVDAYFKSSPSLHQGLRDRFAAEKADALANNSNTTFNLDATALI